MKKWLLVLSMVWALGVFSGAAVWSAEKTSADSEWDLLLDDDAEDVTSGAAPGMGGPGEMGPMRGPRMEGDRRGRRGEAGEAGPGPRGDRERGPGAGRGGRGGFRQMGPVDPEQLMAFLEEHEPTLAAKLKTLQQEDPEKYQRQIPVLSRIYGNVMRQMATNPAAGELSLQRVRLSLKVKKAVQDVKAVGEGESDEDARDELQASVGELFELILKQEKMKIEDMETRLNQWSKASDEADKPEGEAEAEEEADEDAAEDRPARARRRDGRGPGRQERQEQFGKRLAEQKALIDIWSNNREKIIDSRVAELLQGEKPFPWGRP